MSDALRRAAAARAFPGEEWDDDRLAGLKDLIMECQSSDYESDEGDGEDLEDDELDDDEPSSDRKPKLDVGLIFGPPKKSK